jgi:hypothetical protein
MEQVRSPKLLSQYGKMLEKEKNFERAYKVVDSWQIPAIFIFDF